MNSKPIATGIARTDGPTDGRTETDQDQGLFALEPYPVAPVENDESRVVKYTEALLLDAVERHIGGRGVLLRQVTLQDSEAMDAWGAAIDAGLRIGPLVTSRRIDGLLLIGSQRTAIEIKCSRGDFRNDTPEKTRAWRKHAHRFIYVTPKGLLRPSQMVEGAGLWEWDGERISVARRAKSKSEVPDWPDSFVRTLIWRAANVEVVL